MRRIDIDIAQDFSDMPYGRYSLDGPDNGERFRKEILVPAFKENDEIHVFMDGTLGYGSSFLDEAFAGLYRNEGISKSDIKRKLHLHSELNYVIESVFKYIDEAQKDNAGR